MCILRRLLKILVQLRHDGHRPAAMRALKIFPHYIIRCQIQNGILSAIRTIADNIFVFAIFGKGYIGIVLSILVIVSFLISRSASPVCP